MLLKFQCKSSFKHSCDDKVAAKQWNASKKDDFINNINSNKIEDILRELTSLENENDTSIDALNHVVSSIGQVFLDSAIKTNGCESRLNNSDKKTNNKSRCWFNAECKTARRNFHTARFMFKLKKNDANKENLNVQGKHYKKVLNSNFNIYRREKAIRLKQMSKAKPKEFWKVLKSKQSSNVNASLEDMYNHFKNINSNANSDNIDLNDDNMENIDIDGNELNIPITYDEIEKAIKQLKNNKACGEDNILNEHIKYSYCCFKEVYIKLFNIMFDKGLVPQNWTVGIIHPIYKNKGDTSDPVNYRPITLLSCFGKLFTLILNNRFQNFVKNHDLLSEYQSGFRQGYSTVDNMFVINMLIDLLHNSKKKLFCAFIDLKGAFDTINRSYLWLKLDKMCIAGKFIQIIKNMYENAKSCVRVNGVKSNYFPCTIGVRQGESLSPLLFSMFVNDLHSFFANSNIVKGIIVYKHDDDVRLIDFLKLFVLLYADDTVILAESYTDLQNALNIYENYCKRWQLTVNTTKTKVLIFSKGRRVEHEFLLCDDKLEIVNEYKYLGVLFSRSGSFFKAKEYIAKQATKAMFVLLKKARYHCLSIELQIDLFHKVVKPILLYGCECWGYGNINILEKVQLKYLKYVLGVKSSTPNCIVYGETGVKPLNIDINTRLIDFWSKLITPPLPKLTVSLYNIVLSRFMFSENPRQSHFQWIRNIKEILIKCGHINIWQSHDFLNRSWLKKTVYQKLSDLFINEWFSTINTSRKCINYRLYKEKFEFENYLVQTPYKLLRYMIKFRTRNNKLPVEIGSWNNVEYNDRKCLFCNDNSIGDEYHYLLECQEFVGKRKSCLDNKYIRHPNIIKFKQVMQIRPDSGIHFEKLCKLIKEIMVRFS